MAESTWNDNFFAKEKAEETTAIFSALTRRVKRPY